MRNIMSHDDTWASRRLKSHAARLFAQNFVRANIKENIKAPYPCSFLKGILSQRAREFPSQKAREFPSQRASNTGSVSCHDTISIVSYSSRWKIGTKMKSQSSPISRTIKHPISVVLYTLMQVYMSYHVRKVSCVYFASTPLLNSKIGLIHINRHAYKYFLK